MERTDENRNLQRYHFPRAFALRNMLHKIRMFRNARTQENITPFCKFLFSLIEPQQQKSRTNILDLCCCVISAAPPSTTRGFAPCTPFYLADGQKGKSIPFPLWGLACTSSRFA
jgi:hypothetical protein